VSRWNDQFQSHPFRATWTSLKAVLEEEDLEKGNNDAAIKEIARLRKVAAYVDAVMEQIDPELIPLSHLDAFNQHASNCLQQLNSFKGNQNIGQLHNANTNIDALIALFMQTPFTLLAQQKGALGKAASAYATTLDRHLMRLTQAVNAEIEAVKSSVTKIKADITGSDKTVGTLNDQLQVVTQTIQKQTAEFNTQFQANEKTRTDKFDTLATKLQERADNEFKGLATKAGATLEVLGKFHDDAAKVFGVVVNTLQAGAYSSYANVEKKTAVAAEPNLS
jgi:septal ring factor EnvC (AmiA/AmiB activator)